MLKCFIITTYVLLHFYKLNIDIIFFFSKKDDFLNRVEGKLVFGKAQVSENLDSGFDQINLFESVPLFTHKQIHIHVESPIKAIF